MGAKLKNLAHLHFIVFIWGFTAVIGKLISIEALPLVWYRMGIAALLILVFIAYKKYSLKVSRKIMLQLLLGGAALALHWVTFFWAIKVSTVSIALATMSIGAFFTALMEPLLYKRKLIWYELFFGLVVILGLVLIFNVETTYATGMFIAVVSAFMGVVFTLINGKLIATQKATLISFYELSTGVVLISILMVFQGGFNTALFDLSQNDWMFIAILASVCTAYAFIGGVHVMKHITPFTVVLTLNLEPVYGIVLAFFILGDAERMSPMFYAGAGVILATVIANGMLKNQNRLKKREAT